LEIRDSEILDFGPLVKGGKEKHQTKNKLLKGAYCTEKGEFDRGDGRKGKKLKNSRVDGPL